MNETIFYDCVVGIINHSNLELIKKSITSVIRETNKKYLITVLDNSPNNLDFGILKHEFPEIIIASNKKISGFAENMNILIKEFSSKAKYFLILNDDTEITENAIDRLINYLETNKNIAAISPKLIFPDRTPQLSGGFFNMKKEVWRFSGLGTLLKPRVRSVIGTYLNKFVHEKNSLMKYLKSFYETNNPWIADYISGTCMLLRCEAISNVGTLSEDYFMYAEDVDWCKRARMKGWKVGVFPRAIVIHYQNKSMNLRSFIERERSSLIFFSKYYNNKIYLILYRVFIIILSFIRLLLFPLFKTTNMGKKELFLGYLDIMRIMLKNELNKGNYIRQSIYEFTLKRS